MTYIWGRWRWRWRWKCLGLHENTTECTKQKTYPT